MYFYILSILVSIIFLTFLLSIQNKTFFRLTSPVKKKKKHFYVIVDII